MVNGSGELSAFNQSCLRYMPAKRIKSHIIASIFVQMPSTLVISSLTLSLTLVKPCSSPSIEEINLVAKPCDSQKAKRTNQDLE